jgi:ABC-type polysaccharide/polyol phosphate export permease
VSQIPVAQAWPQVIREEGRKVFAFLRRDFLTAFSYRLPFVADWLSLLLQTLIFAFIGKLIRPEALPTYRGLPIDYLEFVAVGITLSSFIAVGLSRLSTALRQEQVQGTLEVLLLTPTAWGTIQLGSAVYDVLYVPIRTAVFLGLTTLVFHASYEVSGLMPALAVLVAFIPCVWGFGVVSASATLTFRRGSGGIGILVTLATLGSGTYVPLAVLPSFAQRVAGYNPIAIAVSAMRDALLGGASFSEVAPAIAKLVPMSIGAMLLGAIAFRAALARERRNGTLGLY